MKTCTNCNNQIEDDKKFCNKCGTPLSDVVVSPKNKTDYPTFLLLAIIGWNLIILGMFLILPILIDYGYIHINKNDSFMNIYSSISLLNYIVLIAGMGGGF